MTVLTVRVNVILDDTSSVLTIPTLLVNRSFPSSILDFVIEHANRKSLSWIENHLYAIRLFLEYLAVNPNQDNSFDTFRNFSFVLHNGSFDLKAGIDKSNLCWKPKSPISARRIIRSIAYFFNWYSDRSDFISPLNTQSFTSTYDKILFDKAYEHRREEAFLGHIWDCSTERDVPSFYKFTKQLPTIEKRPPLFPEEHFLRLINDGFLSGKRPNIRNAVITLLLNGAGFRVSEPFHLFVEDVFPDPTNPKIAMVLIHNPEIGFSPASPSASSLRSAKVSRKEYLRLNYGQVPRTIRTGSKHAGWKSQVYDGKYYQQAYWFPEFYGELFLMLWKKYLVQIASIRRDNPYAFINMYREPKGEQYSIKQYRRSHDLACKRIGLAVSKEIGATPHGHRHSYGQRLRKAEVTNKMIMKFMHHRSISAQNVYTYPSESEVKEALLKAEVRLKEKE